MFMPSSSLNGDKSQEILDFPRVTGLARPLKKEDA